MVLVRLYRCGCTPRHTTVGQVRGCPMAFTRTVVRTHECGRRLQPIDARELKTA
jgi:hypothetical protein